MKLLNIIIDFDNTLSCHINQNQLTDSCLSALNITNNNLLNSRGVLVRLNNKIVLYPENRYYNGYIIDIHAKSSYMDLYIEYISTLSSANISTQLSYDTNKYIGNLSVVKCDQTISCKLSFYCALKDRSKNVTYLFRGDLNIEYDRVWISSFENCDLVPLAIQNSMFNFLSKSKNKTCYQIFHILRDKNVLKQYELEYFSKHKQSESNLIFDKTLSYTYNDLL